MSGQMYTKYGKTCRKKKSSKGSEKSDKKDKADQDLDKKDKSEDDQPIEEGNNEIAQKSADSASGIDTDAQPKEDDTGSAFGTDAGADDDQQQSSPAATSAPADEGEEDEGEPYRKNSSGVKDSDTAESNDESENADAEGEVKGNDENDENSADEGREGETDSNEEDEDSEESAQDDHSAGGETVEDEESQHDSVAIMEYEIRHMYPEIEILIQKKRREWDFQDPAIIRAIWLETKTNVLADWKVRNARIKTSKPAIEVRDTVTVKLRQEDVKKKAELQQALEKRDFQMNESHDPPHFKPIQLATNLTTDMRYKYNRNNPPVPSHYIEYFEKFKKPPFKNNAI